MSDDIITTPEEILGVPGLPEVPEVLAEEKPKRKRRTRAEIEADEAAAQGIQQLDGYSDEIEAVVAELAAQGEKWGVQDHPLIGGFPERENLLRRNYKAREVELQQQNKGRVEADTIGWDSILLEEAYEALSEGDLDKAYVELIQTAAVAINAAASIKRQAVSK
jgi:hypothetical protein